MRNEKHLASPGFTVMFPASFVVAAVPVRKFTKRSIVPSFVTQILAGLNGAAFPTVFVVFEVVAVPEKDQTLGCAENTFVPHSRIKRQLINFFILTFSENPTPQGEYRPSGSVVKGY